MKSGYTYEYNIYEGDEMLKSEVNFGERVVNKLVVNIRFPDHHICFARFFTCVNLKQNIYEKSVKFSRFQK